MVLPTLLRSERTEARDGPQRAVDATPRRGHRVGGEMVRVGGGSAHEPVEVGHTVVDLVRVAVVGRRRGRGGGGATRREW